MKLMRIGALTMMVLLAAAMAKADVVINEIFYDAPNDLRELQWIELHNTAAEAADLSEWTVDKGKTFTFPKGTSLAADGYLVVALKPDQFKRAYGTAALGPMQRPLKRSGERIELYDAKQNLIDCARYKESDPWPVSAAGYSASLERICPTAGGEKAENWAASPLPSGAPKPAGTPGKRNASYSSTLPPTIDKLTGATDELAPGQPLPIEAKVKDKTGVREVSLLYRTVTAGVESKESVIPMTRDGDKGRFAASIPPQPAGTLIRYRIKATSEAGAVRLYPAENDLRPTLSTYVHDKWESASLPFAFIIHVGKPWPKPNEARPQPRPGHGGPGFLFGFGGGALQPSRPVRGTSAFVYVDQKTGKATLFDHVNIVQRNGERGYKVHFHKDQTLNGMSVISIINEGAERFLLAEALAYDVYRRAGNPAALTDFVRLWVDGRLVGYHLLIEQPNGSFLRRNNVHGGGDLYKLIWYGGDVVGQHEKRTNVQTGHADLLSIIDKLQKTRGEEQWKLIEANFNVDEVATYFAVNMVLSHWDGFFNNHFVYHDISGSGKWEMYPWDQDKTWGYHDGIRDDQVFYDMPLTFGMEGDQPPGERNRRGFFGGGFGGGAPWWRPGGYFSRPLLANPQFRRIFLARTKEILDKVYTQENYFPLIDRLADRLKEDVRLLAKLRGEDPEAGARLLSRNVQSLRTHLLKRRQFLLEQPELRTMGINAAPPAGVNNKP